MMRWGALMLLLLAACDALPRDPAATSQRIAQTHSFSVAALDPSVREARDARRLVAEIERRSGATAQWSRVSGEAALKRLDDGTLDLVLGNFDTASPWATDVALGPPLATQGKSSDAIELKAAMRNGENRWIMMVERASRAVSAEARTE